MVEVASETFDVVVVGAGLAGHCAAITALEKGARVAFLEKMQDYGGSSIKSGGSFAFSNTEDQRAVGITDSDELFVQDLVKAANGKCDMALVRTYLNRQHEIHVWLKSQGVEFHKVSLSSSTSVPRTHPTYPPQLLSALHDRALTNERLSWLPNTRALRLIPGSGRIQGVEVDCAGAHRTLYATGGVILATGGFARSDALLEKFAPDLVGAPSWGGPGNTGDGLTMAWALGADVADVAYITGTFGFSLNNYPELKLAPDQEPYLRMANYRGAIIVNVDAKRFADESLSYKKLGTYTLDQPKRVAFQLFDEAIMAQSAPAPTINDLNGALEKGLIRKAADIAALAAAVGLDAAVLKTTIDHYNEDVDRGVDRYFGRKTLANTFGKPVKIETPPFYIFPCTTAILATYCGVRVNSAAQVLNVFGERIPGLYAAGETTGGFHGPGYVSGSALGKAAIYGRIAGENAAAGV